MKLLLALIVGLACGYYVGYRDAAAGNPTIVERVIGHIGAKSRGDMSNDVDAQMKQVEDGSKAGAKNGAPAPR